MSNSFEKIKSSLTYFSPNMLKLFSVCPAKFYYRFIEQVSAPFLDEKFRTGKNIHALASYFLRGIDIKKFEKVLNEHENMLWLNLKLNKYFNLEPVGVEKTILFGLYEFWLGGRLDAIVKSDEDYYILDYKTGGVDDNMTFDYQTMVYMLACDKYIEDYKNLYFVYIDLKNNKNIEIKFTNELKKEYQDRLKTICDLIFNFDITKYDKKNDCKCEYISICKPTF